MGWTSDTSGWPGVSGTSAMGVVMGSLDGPNSCADRRVIACDDKVSRVIFLLMLHPNIQQLTIILYAVDL